MASQGTEIFAMFYEFGIFIAGLTLIFSIIKRYRERKAPPALFLALTYTTLLLAVFMSAIGRILRLMGAVNLPGGRTLEILAITVSCVLASDVFYLAFTLDVFHEKVTKKANKIVLLTYTIAAALGIAYILTTGLFVVDLTTQIWLIVLAMSIGVYVLLIFDARRLAAKLEDDLAKRSLFWVGVSPVCLIFTFALFFLDRMLGADFTPLYIPAWLFGLLATFAAEIGYLQPEWFKKRVALRGVSEI
ncbi:MAG: hypothetical protein ACTSU5_01980 [Promethearchaeota archaeon]